MRQAPSPDPALLPRIAAQPAPPAAELRDREVPGDRKPEGPRLTGRQVQACRDGTGASAARPGSTVARTGRGSDPAVRGEGSPQAGGVGAVEAVAGGDVDSGRPLDDERKRRGRAPLGRGRRRPHDEPGTLRLEPRLDPPAVAACKPHVAPDVIAPTEHDRGDDRTIGRIRECPLERPDREAGDRVVAGEDRAELLLDDLERAARHGIVEPGAREEGAVRARTHREGRPPAGR